MITYNNNTIPLFEWQSVIEIKSAQWFWLSEIILIRSDNRDRPVSQILDLYVNAAQYLLCSVL